LIFRDDSVICSAQDEIGKVISLAKFPHHQFRTARCCAMTSFAKGSRIMVISVLQSPLWFGDALESGRKALWRRGLTFSASKPNHTRGNTVRNTSRHKHSDSLIYETTHTNSGIYTARERTSSTSDSDPSEQSYTNRTATVRSCRSSYDHTKENSDTPSPVKFLRAKSIANFTSKREMRSNTPKNNEFNDADWFYAEVFGTSKVSVDRCGIICFPVNDWLKEADSAFLRTHKNMTIISFKETFTAEDKDGIVSLVVLPKLSWTNVNYSEDHSPLRMSSFKLNSKDIPCLEQKTSDSTSRTDMSSGLKDIRGFFSDDKETGCADKDKEIVLNRDDSDISDTIGCPILLKVKLKGEGHERTVFNLVDIFGYEPSEVHILDIDLHDDNNGNILSGSYILYDCENSVLVSWNLWTEQIMGYCELNDILKGWIEVDPNGLCGCCANPSKDYACIATGNEGMIYLTYAESYIIALRLSVINEECSIEVISYNYFEGYTGLGLKCHNDVLVVIADDSPAHLLSVSDLNYIDNTSSIENASLANYPVSAIAFGRNGLGAVVQNVKSKAEAEQRAAKILWSFRISNEENNVESCHWTGQETEEILSQAHDRVQNLQGVQDSVMKENIDEIWSCHKVSFTNPVSYGDSYNNWIIQAEKSKALSVIDCTTGKIIKRLTLRSNEEINASCFYKDNEGQINIIASVGNNRFYRLHLSRKFRDSSIMGGGKEDTIMQKPEDNDSLPPHTYLTSFECKGEVYLLSITLRHAWVSIWNDKGKLIHHKSLKLSAWGFCVWNDGASILIADGNGVLSDYNWQTEEIMENYHFGQLLSARYGMIPRYNWLQTIFPISNSKTIVWGWKYHRPREVNTIAIISLRHKKPAIMRVFLNTWSPSKISLCNILLQKSNQSSELEPIINRVVDLIDGRVIKQWYGTYKWQTTLMKKGIEFDEKIDKVSLSCYDCPYCYGGRYIILGEGRQTTIAEMKCIKKSKQKVRHVMFKNDESDDKNNRNNNPL